MTTPPDTSRIFSHLEGDAFTFRCHSGISCFNECCAALQLVLTPFDVLRLKNRLGITGEDFLERYADTVLERSARFPIIRLKMMDNEKQTCPFVSPEGCTLYSDRPGSCRIYPMGRASAAVRSGGVSGGLSEVEEKFFMVKEAHCRGFEEAKSWTVADWMQGEGLGEYNAVNDRWLEIITSQQGLGDDSALEKKMKMYMMVCYNLERFKAFLFGSSFFSHFDVSEEEKENIEADDTALLLFGLNWLKFSLFGEKTMKVSP